MYILCRNLVQEKSNKLRNTKNVNCECIHVAGQLLVGLDPLVIQVSEPLHSVGLLWTSDRPVYLTTQFSQQTSTLSRGIRTRNSSK